MFLKDIFIISNLIFRVQNSKAYLAVAKDTNFNKVTNVMAEKYNFYYEKKHLIKESSNLFF